MSAVTADDAGAFGKVAVLMGGRSAERAISLKSGDAVLRALKQRGVDAHAVDTGDKDFVQRLRDGGFNRVFNALHGRGGEDGVVQGLLEVLEISYTGSGVLGSALAMDKLRTKQVWIGADLPTPAFVMLYSASDLEAASERLGFPMMLKPVHEGSSIGMTKVERDSDLHDAWRNADRYDREVLAERWVQGQEFTAAIVGDTALPLIRLETPREFYDYEAKYEADSTRYHCPCGLPESQETELRELAQRAFHAVGASGWGRVDFFLDVAQQPWLIEVNTVPGMTDHSLVPMAAKVFGWDMQELVWRILETSTDETC
ncbi:D-alanine--D-alanine ligase [Thiogranum longum]